MFHETSSRDNFRERRLPSQREQVAGLLLSLDLIAFHDALAAIGATSIAHLRQVTSTELASMGMKPLQRRKLLQELQRLEATGPTSSHREAKGEAKREAKDAWGERLGRGQARGGGGRVAGLVSEVQTALGVAHSRAEAKGAEADGESLGELDEAWQQFQGDWGDAFRDIRIRGRSVQFLGSVYAPASHFFVTEAKIAMIDPAGAGGGGSGGSGGSGGGAELSFKVSFPLTALPPSQFQQAAAKAGALALTSASSHASSSGEAKGEGKPAAKAAAKAAAAECPAGHRLAPFRTPNAGFFCDGCNASAGAGSLLHGCRACDYDECGQCASRNPAASPGSLRGGVEAQQASAVWVLRAKMELTPTCPLGHPLRFTYSSSSEYAHGWCCDGGCGGSFAREVARHYCSACSTDVCQGCVQRGGGGGTPARVLEGPCRSEFGAESVEVLAMKDPRAPKAQFDKAQFSSGGGRGGGGGMAAAVGAAVRFTDLDGDHIEYRLVAGGDTGGDDDERARVAAFVNGRLEVARVRFLNWDSRERVLEDRGGKVCILTRSPRGL